MNSISRFIPADLVVNSWNDIEPYFDKLKEMKLKNVADLENLILKYSEVLSVYSEQHSLAYIGMTCHTDSPSHVKRQELFEAEIDPHFFRARHALDLKIQQSPFFDSLPKKRYSQFKKKLDRGLVLFREANVELETRLAGLATQYSQIAGSLTVSLDGQEMTLPQAKALLVSPDRHLREKVWKKIFEARMKAKPALDEIFNQMVGLRHQMAVNAGYVNYRDYKHDSDCRFDYTPQDVLALHTAIKNKVLPLAKKILQKKKTALGIEGSLRPWDTEASQPGLSPLKPFQQTDELIDKSIELLGKIHPDFGNNLKRMRQAGLLDLESRKGKAPGGYNMALQITGMPFIFMNSAGIHRDLTTLMHEGGHAMHTFLTRDEPLVFYRTTPMEIAEVASMSMELLTGSYWNIFYTHPDRERAWQEYLNEIVLYLPWYAIVDKFQHWIYLNPQHTAQERDKEFARLMTEFGTGMIDWSSLEPFYENYWQAQLHIFEVPFYYIEYAIAQIGALQVYRNCLNNREKGLLGYIRGLKAGGSLPLPEVWSLMGIRFDFSEKMVGELMEFVARERIELPTQAFSGLCSTD